MDFQRLDEDGLPVKEANPNVWEIYMREAKVYDTAMVERWKTAMEGLLIFAGLFSAAVTAFIIESYQTLQPDTGNITVDLLYQLTQQMSAIANGTQLPPPALLPPPSQTSFSPGFAAIATNVLWFISLGLSLACAVAATLVQQWARNYIHTIERRPSAERRARMRMYLFEGVERFKMSQLIDAVPALLHLALFSFFLGLIFFIQPISTPLTVISIVILVVCVAAYLFATFLPLFAFDCPIQTPLTSVVWQKKIVRILYKTCAHSTLIYTALRLTTEHIHPLGMIRVVLDPLWTVFDLLFRQMASGLQTMLKLPSHTLLRWTLLSELWPDIAAHWSPHWIESHALDSIRFSVANDRDDSRFQQREISAFGWLAECLDGYNELLPFIEAIPNFLSQQLDSDYDPQVTFSVVFQQPKHAPEFHNRLASLSETYFRNARVASAYVDFYLCLNKTDWTDLKRALDPMEQSFIMLRVYSTLQGLECGLYPPDLQVRIHCLLGIVQSWSWHPIGPVRNPVWPARYLDLWRTLAKHCSLGHQAGSARTNHVYDAHLILPTVMLNIIQDLTPTNPKDHKAFITFLDNVVNQIVTWCNDNSSPCLQHPLPSQEQLLYCTTISLVISVLDTEYRHKILYDVAQSLHKLFHLLCHMSEVSSLRIVSDLLQRPLWTKHQIWEGEFLSIAEVLADQRDEEGQAYLSSDILAKYHILKSFASCNHLFDNLALHLRFDGPLFRGNIMLQDLLLQKSSTPSIFLSSRKDLETGIEKDVLLYESVFQAFYFFDDHEMLKKASQVVDKFLMRYPYNAHALECKLFLVERIAETG